jgi:hypothetical protein
MVAVTEVFDETEMYWRRPHVGRPVFGPAAQSGKRVTSYLCAFERLGSDELLSS